MSSKHLTQGSFGIVTPKTDDEIALTSIRLFHNNNCFRSPCFSYFLLILSPCTKPIFSPTSTLECLSNKSSRADNMTRSMLM